MSGPNDWLSLAEGLGAWLSTYLLHSTVLLAPALLLARWLGARRLALQEAVLRVALVGGLLTATLQAGLGWQAATGSIPFRGLAGTSAAIASPAPVAGALPPAAASPAPAATADGTGRSDPVRRGSTVATAPVRPLPWLALAVAAWMLGAALLTLRLGRQAWRLRGALLDRDEIREGTVYRLFWRLLAAADVDRPTRLTGTENLPIPVALGVGRREICLPGRVVRELPREQQETVLAHELAHLERHDPAWLVLGRCLESVLFAQPLNRFARRKLQEIAEYRCDDWAAEQTGRPLTLARCLTEVASWRAAGGFAALAPTLAGRPSGLGRRVRRLVDPGYSSFEARLPGWWRPLAVAGLVLVLVAVPGFSVVEEPSASSAAPAPSATEEGSVAVAARPAQGAVRVAPVDEPEAGPVVARGPVVAPAIALRPTLALRIEGVRPALAPDLLPAVRPHLAVAPRVRLTTAAVASVGADPEPRRPESPSAWRSEEESWEEEMERELEALEDELDGMLDELDESIEEDLEAQMEALEDELEAIEDEVENTLEVQLEAFEDELGEQLEAFEAELETVEEHLERRFDSGGRRDLEDAFEDDLDDLEDGLDRLLDRIDDRLDDLEERFESRLPVHWEHDVEHRLDRRLDEIGHRIEGEAARSAREVYEALAAARREGRDLAPEERQQLLAAARSRMEAVRPSPEELAAIHAEMARARETLRPSPEELEVLRVELREELAGLRTEAASGLAEWRAELERLRREHEVR